MFYRITIDLCFTDYDPLNDLLEEARRRLDQAFNVNPHTDQEERGFVRVQKCYHDEAVLQECEVLSEDFVPYP